MRLQSAMEYLMTYGWAILVIAIVLGMLYYLGIFSGGNVSVNACMAQPGYLCANPRLSANGILQASISAISSSPVTVTAVGCSNTSAVPSSFTSVSSTVLTTGTIANFLFQCPSVIPQLGAEFRGTIWIEYSTALQSNLLVKVASITAVVTSLGATTSNSLGYMPITLSNLQSSATSTPFQQMITVSSSTYSQYINSGWTNVEFTSGSPATSGGTALQAWVESSPSNSASSTIVWVNLPGGIPANSNTVIYMNFMSSNIMSSSGPTGEAPQLSPYYAEYDNGALVFSTLYENFAGTSVPSGWTASGSSVIDNGLLIRYTSGVLSYVRTSASYNPNPNTIFEVYGHLNGGGNGYNYGFGLAQSPGYYNLGWWVNTNIVDTAWPSVGVYSLSPSATDNVYSMIYPANGNLLATYNYGSWDAITGGKASGAANWMAGFMYSSGISGEEVYTQWARLRSYPPSGVMPSQSFGNVIT